MERWVEKSEAAREKEEEGARAMAREGNRDEIRGGEKQQKLQVAKNVLHRQIYLRGFTI